MSLYDNELWVLQFKIRKGISMSYQMMVLIHVTKKKSYCTGNKQFLRATSRENLFEIITDPNRHGEQTSTFNQKFRPLFDKNPNELAFVLFEGDSREIVESKARGFADGRVCNNKTEAQGDPNKHYGFIKSTLNPVIITIVHTSTEIA